MNTDTIVLLFVLEHVSHYFWVIMWMKNVNSFQTGIFRPRDVG